MSENDKRIKDLLKIIEEKKAKLGEKPRMTLRTNGIFKSEGKVANINTICNLDQCVRYVAEIIGTYDSFVKAAELLGIDKDLELFKTTEDLLEDFKLKAKIIKWNIEDSKIKEMEIKLKELRSENLKTSDELDEITKNLGIKFTIT